MKSLQTFLTELNTRDIKLWVEGEQLRCSAPEGVLTGELVGELQQHKQALLAFLRAGQTTGTHAPIQPVARTGDLPLSYAQERLWFLDQLGGGSAYHMAGALKLEGPLDVAVLQQSLNEIVRRHEVLRTTFARVTDAAGQRTVQVIAAHAQVALPLLDLHALAAADQSSEVQQFAKNEAHRPFDLTQDLMLRVTLLRLGAESHILLLTFHHIASDGWSVGLFMAELVTLYTAFAQGQPSPLPPLSIQYADFAQWQRQSLQGERMARQLAFWRTQLADAPLRLELPTDYPRPAVQSFQGATVNFVLDAALTQALHGLSRQAGSTIFMTLLAAFQVLLARYSGQNDIIVGAPIANRNHQAIEPLLGFFVNTLALRANLAANPTFSELLAQVRQTTQLAYDHQDLPFEKLVDELNPARDLAYTPLVQVMFALQQPPTATMNAAGVAVKLIDFGDRVVRFDLEAHLWERGDQLEGSFIYNSDLFTAATMARMVGHWQTLLTAIIEHPHQPVAQLPLLTAAEHQQLLVEWNATAAPYPKTKTIPQLFEEQVARTPDAVALCFKQKTLTYRELNARANQLAHHLQALGVGPEMLVGCCVERSIEMVVGLLAILKAGGAYVPLDPTYPPERLGFMLADAQISLLLTQAPLVEKLPTPQPQIFCLDRDWATIMAAPLTDPKADLTAEKLAYVIYTSGSTGQPKGVMIQHNSVSNLISWHQTVYGLTQHDRTTQVAGPAFDAVVWELWPTLTAGAALYIMDDETRSSPEQLLQWLADQAITVAFLPTPLAETVLRTGLPANLALRLLLTGGDRLHHAPAALPFTLVNNYGPTENTVVTTWIALPPDATEPLPPIGRPICNTQVYLLDAQQQPVPIGVPGELTIGGDSLARGYLNRPALTSERFTANPFGAGRLYKTGDLVRWRPDGLLEFLGRIDQQVKLRGFRIELGEIEAVLSQCAGVQDAVVVMRAEQADNQQLVAYIVAAEADETIQTQHVTTWQKLYEESYSQAPAAVELNLNLTGWNSSYTGAPIEAAEMVAWMEDTVAEIRSLQPQRVLEIGCGTGLLLARLAPDCVEYVGVDYSQQALAHVARLCAAEPQFAHVELMQRMADDFADLAPARFDCVILNSVVQYFPSADYLLRVLAGAVRVVKPGGKIYVGDVRNYRLLAAYHAAVQLYQSPDEASLAQLQGAIYQRLHAEEELLIDPDFFHALPQHLPQLGHGAVHLKRGHYCNELTQFRYQVILHVADQTTAPSGLMITPYREESWVSATWTLAILEAKLATQPGAAFVVRNIPNARVQAAINTLARLEQSTPALRTTTDVAHLRAELAAQPAGIEPEALWAIGERLPYRVNLTWSAAPGLMDASFVPQGLADPHPGATALAQPASRPWRAYTNNPLLGKLNRTLLPTLHSDAQRKLPDYMIPTAFVLLDHLPLTPNGKVDRKALPSPVNLQHREAAAFAPPTTPTECTITEIWSALLGVDQIGRHDNFFALGGHSLLATQAISRVNDALRVKLPLRAFFEEATIAHLAETIENVRWALQPTLPTTPVGEDVDGDIDEFATEFEEMAL